MGKVTIVVFCAFIAMMSLHSVSASEEDKVLSREKRALPGWMRNALRFLPHWCAATGGAAAGRMARAYYDMRQAGWINCDKYFHCRGNKEAAQMGYCGKLVALAISEAREWAQGNGSDSAEDRRANNYGRNGRNCVQRYIRDTYSTSRRCSLPRRLW